MFQSLFPFISGKVGFATLVSLRAWPNSKGLILGINPVLFFINPFL